MCLMQHSIQQTAEKVESGLEKSSATVSGNDTGDDNYSYH